MNKKGQIEIPPLVKIQYPMKNQGKDRSLVCCQCYMIL